MCICLGPVKMEGTDIMVGAIQPTPTPTPTPTATPSLPPSSAIRQFTVYSNEVVVEDQQVLMILPFPKSNVEFVVLQDYTKLFHDLEKVAFPKPPTRSRSHDFFSNSTLQVMDVGSYKVSIASSLADIERVNVDVFNQLTPKIKQFLETNYADDGSLSYSFLICKLDNSQKYHPFGYIHDSLPDGSLFIPTMHYHTHKDDATDVIHTDWNHRIYSFGYRLAVIPSSFQEKVINVSSNSPIQFYKLPSKLMHKTELYAYKINDYSENHDMLAVRTPMQVA